MLTASIPLYRPSVQPEKSDSAPLALPRLSGSAGDIARMVAERGSLTISEAVETGYPRRSAQRALASIVDEGVITPKGNGRAHKYVPTP